MYRFLRQSTSKLFLTILLISSILLLCPTSPTSSTTDEPTSFRDNTPAMSNHGASTDKADSGSSPNHPGFESHNIFTPQSGVDYLALLFLVAFGGLILASSRGLLMTNRTYLTKLKYYRQHYRILIKPKLETLFRRWLNLLGGTIAPSF